MSDTKYFQSNVFIYISNSMICLVILVAHNQEEFTG